MRRYSNKAPLMQIALAPNQMKAKHSKEDIKKKRKIERKEMIKKKIIKETPS